MYILAVAFGALALIWITVLIASPMFGSNR
jgi:hypothetical protein